jgi:hypothetical protein
MICCVQGKVAPFGASDLEAAPTSHHTCHTLCPHDNPFKKKPNNLKHLQRHPVHHLRPQHKESKQDHLTQQRIAKNAKKSHRGCENTSLYCGYLHSTPKSLRTHHSEGAGNQNSSLKNAQILMIYARQATLKGPQTMVNSVLNDTV